MSGFYNAVIYDDLKIVARVHLTDQRNVPWWWEIRDGDGNEVVAIKDLDYDPQEPLRIIKRWPFPNAREREETVAEQEFKVLFPVGNGMIALKVREWNTVQDLLYMASRETGLKNTHNAGKLVQDEYVLWNKLHWTLDKLGVNAKNNRFRLLSSQELPDFKVYIKPTTGRGFTLCVHAHIKIEELKTMIEEEIGVSPDQQCLVYQSLLDDERILRDYKITSKCILHLILQLKEGDSSQRPSNFGNLEGERITEVGTRANPENCWRTYGVGLNLKGNCSNPACESQNFQPKGTVVFNGGFWSTVLTNSTSLNCPVCGERTFKSSSFLISGARCSFKYKWAEDKLLTSITVGSDAPFPQCAELHRYKTDKRKFEYIIIRVVPWDHSPHDCFKCGKAIGRMENEMTSKLKGCGHHWHKDCASEVDCAVCLAPRFSETEIKKICV